MVACRSACRDSRHYADVTARLGAYEPDQAILDQAEAIHENRLPKGSRHHPGCAARSQDAEALGTGVAGPQRAADPAIRLTLSFQTRCGSGGRISAGRM